MVGSWHKPSARHNSVLDVQVQPFTPLCNFQSIVKSSGALLDPSLWDGHAPAIAGRFGSGRVVVFGPHPESNRSVNTIGWLAGSIDWITTSDCDDLVVC